MSLEQTFSQKLTLDNKETSSSSTNSTASATALLPGPTSPPPPPPSHSSAPNSSTARPNLSRATSQSIRKREPSPLKKQQSLARGDSRDDPQQHQHHRPTSPPPVGSNPHQSSSHHSGRAAGSGASSTGGVERAHSVRVTRKIFYNWRSACGRTKDRTKDLFRRWKTLPEDHPDFGSIPNPSSSSGNRGSGPTIPSSTSAGINHADSHGAINKIKNTGKKTSEADLAPLNRAASISQEDQQTQQQQQQQAGAAGGGAKAATKSSAGWTVHVWATYVQRGSGDDDTLDSEEVPPGRDFLSDFQKIKLTHFFRHVLDMNHDDVISAADFVALNQRIRHYIEWSSECIEFHILKEVHSGFLECFLNQPLDDCSLMYYCRQDRETREYVNVEEWLDVWGTMLHETRDLGSLPLWLQYFPKILFQVINKSGSGTIGREELRAFYTSFLGIDFRVVNETLDAIYAAMTDGNRNKLNYGTFKLCFANFLYARYPHGPGQYLFGICAPQSLQCPFPIDYSALNTPPDDLEPYKPGSDKIPSDRRSVIV